jgi:hypothetical protein
MDGRSYLDQVIADRLNASAATPAAERDAMLNIAELRGIATGLIAAGVLTQEQADEALATLATSPHTNKVLRQQTAGVAPAGVAVADRVALVRERAAQLAIDRPAESTAALLAVIPLAAVLPDDYDGQTTLISVDVWTTQVQLHLGYPATPDQMRQRFRANGSRPWHIVDDAGTTYRHTGGTGADSNGLYFERVSFAPGPPIQARTLTLIHGIDTDARQWTVALRPVPGGEG